MADRPVNELSGGELQRVWLAACLAQDTAVLDDRSVMPSAPRSTYLRDHFEAVSHDTR